MKPSLTVDIGTTSIKLGLFDEVGGLVRAAKLPTPGLTDADGAIYDMPAVIDAVDSFIGAMTPEQRGGIERIAFGGVGESGALVDAGCTLRSPMILWHDQRGAPWIRALTPEQRDRVYEVTGLPCHANYGISKAAWALDRFGGGDVAWLNISEYLAAHLTGERWAEYSLASRTMALDLRSRTWSAEICELFGVGVEVFPQLRVAADGVPIAHAVAARLGLSTDVRVHVAGHDHMVGAVGADLSAGEVLNSTGTTEGILLLHEEPDLSLRAAQRKLAAGVACDGRHATGFASIPTGGAMFAFLKRFLGWDTERLVGCVAELDDRYRRGAIDLARVPLVVPHLRGSPPPAKSPTARGVIGGLRVDTDSSELVFGCFLAMAAELRRVLELFSVQPTEFKVIGPASANNLWLQLKADILGRDISVSAFPEMVSLGAQVLASGESTDWARAEPWTVRADPARHEALTEWFTASEDSFRLHSDADAAGPR